MVNGGLQDGGRLQDSNGWERMKGMCPVCMSKDVWSFFELFGIPVHCNLLWPTREEALQAPRGDMRLGFCKDCEHIFNLAFDPALVAYKQDYENSLHFSPRFQEYAGSLAMRLVERYDLRGKDIIEIGCGQGDFLRLLCQLGGNRGVGFDPSYVPGREGPETTGQVTVVQDFYSERYADYGADFVCCRHVLEHVQCPREMLTSVRRAAGARAGMVVFFEVPNVWFTLGNLGIWDLIYEHCSYFSAHSLCHLFASCGFEVCDVSEAYEGQFLCIEAVAAAERGMPRPYKGCQEKMVLAVAEFGDRYRDKVHHWQRTVREIVGAGRRAVIWGAGSKGVTFLNALQIRDHIQYAVDINPRKQDMYLPGTGQQIVSPEFLREVRPDVVIVMNAIYEDEIRQFTEGLGLDPEFVCA